MAQARGQVIMIYIICAALTTIAVARRWRERCVAPGHTISPIKFTVYNANRTELNVANRNGQFGVKLIPARSSVDYYRYYSDETWKVVNDSTKLTKGGYEHYSKCSLRRSS